MTSGELIFVLPAGSDAVSGGNLYNARLIDALRGMTSTRTTSIDECRAALERGEEGIYFIDTLNVSDVMTVRARRPGRLLFLVVHHLQSFEPGADDGARASDDAALARFDGFLSTSPLTTELLAKRGLARDKIVTVTPAPPDITRRPRTYEPPLRAAMVANLIPRKGILAFFEALASRALDTDRFFVDVVGRVDIDSDHAARCHDLVRRSSSLTTRVCFTGPVAHAAIGDVYRAASVFVSSATMETFGMSLQEAHAHGLPILALDAGHVAAHFTHGDDGLLFDDVDALADGFLRLARDEGTMRKLFDRAQSARMDAGYTWETAARRLIEQLERSFGIAG